MERAQADAGRKPRVIIIGAGFGGLRAAKLLAKAPVEVVLIDRNNYTMFTPLLYQVATAGLEPDEVVHPVRDIVRSSRNVIFNLGTVRSIDKAAKQVVLEEGPPVSYDYLILAAGSMTNYFGVPGAEEFAFPMKTVPAGLHIRNHVLRQFERAERDPEGLSEGALNIVIVGGGPTGVELAGQFTELFRHVLRKDFRRIDTTSARVILVEALPDLMMAYDPKLRAYSRRELEKRGVEVRTGTTVERVTKDAVFLKGGEQIPANTLIWAAGVKAHPLAESVGTPLTRGGRLATEPDLSLPGHPEIFAIGDIAGAKISDDQMYAQVATVAIYQGKHAARQIMRRLKGEPALPFKYFDPGIMATIGRSSAIAQLAGGIKLKGFLAWLLWAFLHIAKLVSFRDRFDVFLNWVWNYVTYDFGGRLIMDVVPVRAGKKLDEVLGPAFAPGGVKIYGGDGAGGVKVADPVAPETGN